MASRLFRELTFESQHAAVNMDTTSMFASYSIDYSLVEEEEEQVGEKRKDNKKESKKKDNMKESKKKDNKKEKTNNTNPVEAPAALLAQIDAAAQAIKALQTQKPIDGKKIKESAAALKELKMQLPVGHALRPLSKEELKAKKAQEKAASKAKKQKTEKKQDSEQLDVYADVDAGLAAQIKAQTAVLVALKQDKSANKHTVKSEAEKLNALKLQLPEGHPQRPMTAAEKKQALKAKKSAAKSAGDSQAKKKADRQLAKKAQQHAEKEAKACVLTDTYGRLPLMQSRTSDKKKRNWMRLKEMDASKHGQTVWVRGYVHDITKTSKEVTFVLLRQQYFTVQCVVSREVVSEAMKKYVDAHVGCECVVDLECTIHKVDTKVDKVSQQLVELRVGKLFVVSPVAPDIPFLTKVAMSAIDDEEAGMQEETKKAKRNVSQETRLNHRHIDLRTPCSQAVMRISSGVCSLFREFLTSQDFVEIQTPKLLGGASEGGADVFQTDYFGQTACLAQSPQLHKQISCACSGFERVFEIGPVFRAENSNTSRHLCEFHGLDLEMTFNEHYHEVLKMFSDLFVFIFDGLNERFKAELEAVRKVYPFEDLVYKKETPIITFKQAIQWLREAGVGPDEQGDMDDLSTPNEKHIGRIAKEKIGVDFVFIDKYPLSVRPFYTMPDAEDPLYSNSYDFLLRTQEILSGAQRIHDPTLLQEKVAEFGVDVESVKFYIDSFSHGALPHGGGGIGLERVVMLFLGLNNIRMSCLFPRDPKRLTP